MRHAQRFRSTRGAVLAVGLLGGGCATGPQLDAQWADPNATYPGYLRGARVLVACDAAELVVRQICQDHLASEVTARGGTAVEAPRDMAYAPDRAIEAQLQPRAQAASAKALVVMTVAVALTEVNGSSFSFGIGGFGYGGGGGGMGVGVGGTVPTGSMANAGYTVSGRITDATSGKLLWVAKATSPPSPDVNAQMSSLSRIVFDAAQKAGMF
ncbi:MAG TPA: hypothetical protein VMU47_18105 [Caldimonas sp.]|nr:hypothetical protein [Caldimonas sp.]